MVKLSCQNYGFDCKFEIAGNEDTVVNEYQKHSFEEHGIDYSIEALNQFILRMKN